MRLPETFYKERLTGYPVSLSDSEKEAIRQDYEEVTGKKWADSFRAGCPNCYHDSIILINIKMADKNRDTGGYSLKGGVIFKYKGKWITRKNLTKEAAEWFIRQDINNRDKFYELGRDYDSYTEEGAKE